VDGKDGADRRRDAEGDTGHDDSAHAVTGDAHGHTIAKIIERTSEDVPEVERGSLYPALHRLFESSRFSSYWGVSENNRKAKFYRLTAAGKRQLVHETNRWRQMARAIALVMGEKTFGEGVFDELAQTLSP